MTAKHYPRDLDQVVKFHGHFCGGIVVGYRAAKAGMQHLSARRSQDEELVAIVENDSCAADAVQVITGCTFGKGNFFFRDHGKHVYTFALRTSGRAVRVSRKPGPRLSPEGMLTAPVAELFWIEDAEIDLPSPSAIHSSVVCERCGEPVMATRTRRRGSRVLCIPCAQRGKEVEPKPPLRNPRDLEPAAGA